MYSTLGNTNFSVLNMPRRSAADLATIRVQALERPRLNPPEFLDDREQALFRETVQSCSADHFAASDTPLLVSYVQATLMARGAIKDAPADKAALGVWERERDAGRSGYPTARDWWRVVLLSESRRPQHAEGVPTPPLGGLSSWRKPSIWFSTAIADREDRLQIFRRFLDDQLFGDMTHEEFVTGFWARHEASSASQLNVCWAC